METKTYIKVDINWFRNENYIQKTGKLAFAVYALLLEREGCNNRVVFNIDYLMTHLGMNKNNRHIADNVKSALSSLEEHSFIHFHNNMYDDETVEFETLSINKNSNLYASVSIPPKRYTIIYAYELFGILLSGHDDYKVRVSMLSQFCYIISCINNISNICFPSMRNIMESSSIGSYKTVKDNLDRLVELNFLVYRNPNIMNNKGSKTSQTPNHYARPIHEADLEAIVDEKVSKMNKSPMSKNTDELGKLKRSLTQKINSIYKKEEAGTITDEDKFSLYEMAEAYNQLCISSGQKPKFDINAKPEVIEISMEGVNSISLDITGKSLKLNKEIEPFKENPNKTSSEPFDDKFDLDDWFSKK